MRSHVQKCNNKVAVVAVFDSPLRSRSCFSSSVLHSPLFCSRSKSCPDLARSSTTYKKERIDGSHHCAMSKERRRFLTCARDPSRKLIESVKWYLLRMRFLTFSWFLGRHCSLVMRSSFLMAVRTRWES